jgi:glutathione synthase/RimK-type ligase-like ATP-grasp enzyme
MRIGILESKEDLFIHDVLSRLSDVEVEFLSFEGETLPLRRDYRMILDRLSFGNTFLREIMKGLALSGTYIINNPFAAAATNKLIDLWVSNFLGISCPRTVVLPGKAYREGYEEMIRQEDWERIISEVSLPCVVKPFDGFAWEDVLVVSSREELQQACTSLESSAVLLVQQLIKYKDYYRVFCINKRDVLPIKWEPKPLGGGEYIYSAGAETTPFKQALAEQTIRLNASLDLDINAVEWCIDERGQAWVIDAYNEVPEIIKEKMPEVYYNWIVEKLATCIEDKLDSGEKNKSFLPQGEDPVKALSLFYPAPHPMPLDAEGFPPPSSRLRQRPRQEAD